MFQDPEGLFVNSWHLLDTHLVLGQAFPTLLVLQNPWGA